jgi:hypothetical protein
MKAETMTDRTQINFRIENDLLAAIKTKCEEQKITQTNFITNAIKAMLGIETPEDTSVGTELIHELRMQLAETEHRLSERISQLETQYLGELIA